ncbi:MAG: hydroxyethylthiazole kinase [Sneathiella sp.]|uniref:hydroxyethylthiazole kinase n=1 Tax=Sneathiella sp. TaxID=1964365 RepID=UPI000C5B9DB9|nr:hydroxyethylthiazole kinase [Sneathiella sp.]MAZ02486.1 hydroxyethylthiazole kinase [Sneathiella sp.]
MRDNATDELLAEIARRSPAVHCLTNTVVQALTANMLLAVGAIPSMSSDISEVADFVSGANALLINLGTLDGDRKSAIEAAITAARKKNIPWILDPVLIDRASGRLAYAKELMTRQPALIRGNSGEISALNADPHILARKTRAIVAVTGVEDLITDGQSEKTVTGGHMLMSRVTGIGCAGTALLGACLAAADPSARLEAVAIGLRLLGDAGERAANTSNGPGSFAADILDEVYKSSQSSLQERKES